MHKSKYTKASSRIAKRHKIRKCAGMCLKIGLPASLLIGFVFLLRADFLQVKSFEVVGAQAVRPDEIKSLAASFISGNKFFVIPKSDILLLNEDKLVTALLMSFPRIEKVDINKNFFGGNVNLSVTERAPDFVWRSQSGDCFFMTRSGLIFEKVDPAIYDPSSGDKLIFMGILEGDPLMKNFTTAERIQNYLKLTEVFKNNGFTVGSISIETSDKAVAKSNVGDIIFDPEGTDLPVAAQNAVLLINEIKGKNPSAVFNYIDVRFGNKIFYKLY